MRHYELLRFDSNQALARAAARRWVDRLELEHRTTALSGGRIAGQFFDAVVAEVRARSRSLAALHFFWADERCVPPESPDSNYRLARETLLEPLGIAPECVHRLRGELDPDLAAARAGHELREIAPRTSGGWPALDWLFLGMGEDGHVASLFPGAGPDPELESVYAPVLGPKPPARRLTLTYGAIAAAREVWVLVAGAGKEQALRSSLASDGGTPLARVLRLRSNTLIFNGTPLA